MFAQITKWSIRGVALVTAIALVAGIIATILIQIPVVDFVWVSDGLGKALAICYHYIPAFNIIWAFTKVLWQTILAIYGFRFAVMVYKFIFKIFK